ncbi:hypothetical protein C8R41DRAFT_942102, partial [Lentinula lateritia]
AALVYTTGRICNNQTFGSARGQRCIATSKIAFPPNSTQILRSHRNSPSEMRFLGDDYVKADNRALLISATSIQNAGQISVAIEHSSYNRFSW